jgi:hypothetical protein
MPWSDSGDDSDDVEYWTDNGYSMNDSNNLYQFDHLHKSQNSVEESKSVEDLDNNTVTGTNMVKDEQNVPKLLGGEGANKNWHGGRCIRNCWNNTAGTLSNKFKSKLKELEDNTFDNTGPNDAANFYRLFKNIANYLQLQHGANVSKAVQKMSAITITIPAVPQPKLDPTTKTTIPVTLIEEYLWKEDHKKMTARKDKYNKNMPMAYIIIYNQCSNSLKNDLEASDTFQAVNARQDPITLLKLVQGLCCSYNSKTQSVMATVASHKKLFTYFQCDGVDNSTYHWEFMAHIKAIETY